MFRRYSCMASETDVSWTELTTGSFFVFKVVLNLQHGWRRRRPEPLQGTPGEPIGGAYEFSRIDSVQ